MKVFGAVATLDAAAVRAIASATSVDDAYELIKERRFDFLDLDERWHALHWLLARQPTPSPAEPASWAVLGRHLFASLDRGRGAPGLVEPDRVPEVVRALATIDSKTARLRFDAEAMDSAGIYPCTWSRGGVARVHQLLADLKPLSSLFRRAAAQGAGTVGYRY